MAAQTASPDLRSCCALLAPHAAPGRPCERACFPWAASARKSGVSAAVVRASDNGKQPEARAQDPALDVSSVVVDPAFRSTPWREEARQAAEEEEGRPGSTAARLLFVSESNVCRSVLAAAFFARAAAAAGLEGAVDVSTRGTRDYNVGEGPDPLVTRYAEGAGLALPEGHAARVFDPERDIVRADLVLVVDKFVAADVMREVSVYDTINAAGGYTRKVRRLGEFHERLAALTDPEGQDLDDPLYGNTATAADEEAVARCAELIRDSCQGLAEWLARLQREGGGEEASLRAALAAAVPKMSATPWLVPPMLSR